MTPVHKKAIPQIDKKLVKASINNQRDEMLHKKLIIHLRICHVSRKQGSKQHSSVIKRAGKRIPKPIVTDQVKLKIK